MRNKLHVRVSLLSEFKPVPSYAQRMAELPWPYVARLKLLTSEDESVLCLK